MSNSNDTAKFTNDAPLLTEEDALVKLRRKANGETEAAASRVKYGLALSGGGIRSATFALGVMRGLASQGSLHLFDYLSTVSGGGYVGVAYGRLFGENAKGTQVEKCLADDRSMFLWWLRHNGRYLVPAGARDEWLAAAAAIRGWLSSQFSFLLLVFAAASLVALPHAIVWTWPDWGVSSACTQWLPSVWLLVAVLPAMLTAMCMWAYYLLAQRWWAIGAWMVVAVMVLVAALYSLQSAEGSSPWCLSSARSFAWGIASFVAASEIAGGLYLAWWARRGAMVIKEDGAACDDLDRVASLRLGLTAALRGMLLVLVFALLAALLDSTSWWLFAKSAIEGHSLFSNLSSAGAGLVALLAVVRAAMPSLQGNSTNVLIRNVDWLRVAHVLGWLTVIVIVYLAMLALTFLIYGQGRYLPDTIIQWIPTSFNDESRDASRLVTLALVLGLIFVMILGTGWQIESLNLGSLHYLYRARIARAYTSVGSKRRFPNGLRDDANRSRKEAVRRVDEALPGDDTPIADYKPHESGGPLHLINCCINQTRDDRTGNYSADRRGIALTVGPCGFETGAELPDPNDRDTRGTSLAEWAAVSGAAVSSGMGFYTRSGVAILLYLSGLRLGYWMRNLLGGSTRMRPRWRLIPKYRAVHAEAFGSFPGLRSRYWYVSDGGHFENTGVYALVKRKLPLIVLVDAAADPDFLFGDVENLVRKARIDFDANVEFIDPATLPARVGIDASWFGTPYSVVSAAGPEFMLLARIKYCDGKTGCLVIIKPRRTETMPLDVVGYADRNPVFPQESTAHQLFSEQQWESYQALGVEFGRVLTPDVLAAMPELCERSVALPVAPVPGSARVTAQSLQPVQPADSRRARVQQTVRTSLGIGVSISALLGVWQAVQSQIHSGDSSRSGFFTALNAAATQVDQNCVVPARLAASLATLRDASNVVGDIASRSSEMSSIRDAAKQFCPADDSDCYLTYFPALYRSQSIVAPRSTWTWYWTPLARPSGRASNVETDAPDESSMHRCVIRRDVYADGTSIVQPIVVADGAKAEHGTGLANSLLLTATAGKTTTVSAGAVVASTTTDAASAGPVAANGPPRSPAPASGGAALKPATSTATGDAQKKALLSAVKSACPADGPSRRLYAHVYQDSDKSVQTILSRLDDANGIRVMGIENVVATAQRRGLPAPFVWDQPTFLYPTEGDRACAQALTSFYRQASGRDDVRLKQLPASLAGTPGSIEFWLPPSRDGKALPVASY